MGSEQPKKKKEYEFGKLLGGGSFGKVYEVEYDGEKYAGKKFQNLN